MPFFATSSVTASGVSAAKVVATMEVPAIHHLKERPPMKYSSMLRLARFVSTTPAPSANAQ